MSVELSRSENEDLDRRYRTAAIIAFAASALIYLPSLVWSLGHDQNVFAEIGNLLLKGKRPYLDAWDIKPPNIFYINAFAQVLFGRSEFAIRAMDYVWQLATSVLVFFTIRRMFTMAPLSELMEDTLRVAGCVFGQIFYILITLSLGLADTAQTESYSLLLIFLSILLVFRQQDWGFFLSGFSIAIATFFKTTNVIFLLPIFLLIYFVVEEKMIRGLIIVTIGFLTGLGLQVLLLVLEHASGAYLHIFMNVLVFHPMEASEHVVNIWDILRALWTYADIWLLVALVGTFWQFRLNSKVLISRPLLFCYTLLISAAIAVLVQKKGWGYQYVILIPGLVLFISIQCALVVQYVQRRFPKRSAWLVLAAVLFFLFSPSGMHRFARVKESVAAIRDRPPYLATLGTPRSFYYPLCSGILTHYIDSMTTSNDKIFIFGEEPGVYWQSNRMPATRFIYTLLFTSPVIRQKELGLLTSELTGSAPKLIAVERFDTTRFSGRPETSESLLQTERFSGVRELIQSNYTLRDTVCGKFIIYSRR